MGISRAFGPFTTALEVLLRGNKAAPRLLAAASLATALAAVGAIYFLLSHPYSRALMLLAVAALLLNAFLGRVEMEVGKEGGGILVLGRVMDLMILVPALYLLKGQVYNIYGLMLYVGPEGHAFLALAILAGVLLVAVGDLGAGKASWIGSRAERMLLLALILVAGYYSSAFLEAFFSGSLLLAALLYLTLFWRYFRSWTLLLWKVLLAHTSRTARAGLRAAWRGLLWSASGLVWIVGRGLKKGRSHVPRVGAGGQETSPSISLHNFTVLVTDGKEVPIPNVRVTLWNVETGRREAKETEGSGRVDFQVPEGEYKVLLQAEGYGRAEHGRYISMDAGEVFTLAKGAADLSVVVSDASSSVPVQGAKVTLGSGEKARTKVTDPVGVAYFGGLEDAAYEMVVEAQGFASWGGKVDPERESMVAVALVRAQEKSVEYVAGEATLVLHATDPMEILRGVVGGCLENERGVCILAEEGPYAGALAREIRGGGVRFVSPAGLGEGIEAPAGGVVVIPSLAGLVESLGWEATRGAIRSLAGQGLACVGLLEKGALEAGQERELEGLFTHLVEVEGKRPRMVR